MLLLVALLENGMQFSLLSVNKTRDELLRDRKKHQFFCPVCKSQLCLKIGTMKKPYFAHYPDSDCQVHGEPETDQHLRGKEDLYLWTIRNGRKAELEYYLKTLKQRADIFLHGIEPIAIEYQCSDIPEDVYLRRTCGYCHSGILPIWILGSNRIRFRKDRLILSAFETSSIRRAPPSVQKSHSLFSSSYFIYFYDPHRKLFIFFSNIHSCTKTSFISQEIVLPLDQVHPSQLLYPDFQSPINNFFERWVHQKKKQRLNVYRKVSNEEDWLRRQAYQLRFTFSMYPAFCGIPHEQYIHFKNPPYLWQTWICYILEKARGHWITIPQIIQVTVRKGGQALFAMRQLPLVPESRIDLILAVYLEQLVALRFVAKKQQAYSYIGESIRYMTSLDHLLKQDRLYLQKLKK